MTYQIKASVGGPSYAYEVDPVTFSKKKKVEMGKEYRVVGIAKSKKDALKIGYRYSKQTPKRLVFILKKNEDGMDYVWGEAIYTDNPKAWFYNKTIVHSVDDPSNWRQLKYDGTIGKILRERF